jgi:hypothetical protein
MGVGYWICLRKRRSNSWPASTRTLWIALLTYRGINANLQVIFQTLFGGDAENVSEYRIDIFASTPGKRLQSVLLLLGADDAAAGSLRPAVEEEKLRGAPFR